MDEQQMRDECAKIADKWRAGGLAGGSIYEDFAVELAKRVQAAERERCASVLRYWLTGHAPTAGTYEAQCLEHVLGGRPAPTGWAERA